MDAPMYMSPVGSELVPSHRRNYLSADSPASDPRNADASLTLSYGVSYNFIGNSFVLSKSRSWTKVHDPASQGFITRVPESTGAELQDAVASAANAQPHWRATPVNNRRKLLLNLIAIFKQNSSRIRRILCVEVGKTLSDADAEFERGIDALETACSVSNEMSGVHHVNQSAEIHTINEPLGVCLTISPFNFPFMIPLWSLPYAILAGNTVILKPSERTPSVSQVMAECFLQAGFPPGVLNIVHGRAGVVTSLLAQPAVRAVSFVGGNVAGEQVYEHARATRKRVQVECNGKNHGVVLEDASRTKALYAIAGSAFGAAGQRCMAVSVVVFVGATREWVGELVQIARTLVVGCGLDPLVDVGPVITAASKSRVEDFISSAEQEGAKVLLDGRGYQVPDYPSGNFIGPTILTNVQPYMSCYQEEIFGPVLCCIEVATLEEAVDLVNNNRFGNGCTLFTNSPIHARNFQHMVNIGQIGINVPVIAPSGPVLRTANKDSFMGDLNVNGRSAAQFFTMTKTVTTLWT
ncbi:methylmalonate-semialdehyde dehydrogenase [Xylariales sp. PMI_506]|nr:methylmalonate-semialdehyde dehydrogenase [Xylariales sp. PMI_506]